MHYFESHDPTQLNRQGNDIGTQYRSIILYSTEEQKKVINRVLQTFQELLSAAGYGSIATLVKPIRQFKEGRKISPRLYSKKSKWILP